MKKRKEGFKEHLIQQYWDPERFFLVDESLLLYLDDLKLVFYFTYLVRTSIYFSKVKKETNPWFYLDKKLPLPSTFNTPQTRASLNKKLTKLKLIITKMRIAGSFRRKFYKLDLNGMEQLAREIYENLDAIKEAKSKLQDLKLGPSEMEVDTQHIQHNKLLPKGNKKFGEQTSKDRANAQTNEGLHNQTSLRIRRPSLELDIIKHWSAKGKPFARVRKPETITPILKDIINESKGLPEYQYADIALAIVKAIDRAYEYLTHNYFLFKPKSVGMKQFFSPVSAFQHKLYETLAACPYLNGKTKTWYNLFMHASNTWLDQNLLRQVAISDQPFAEKICEHLNVHIDNLTLREKITLKKAMALMDQYIELNNLGYNIFTLLKEYLKHSRRPIKLYYLASKNWWNDEFSDFLIDNRHVMGVNRI